MTEIEKFPIAVVKHHYPNLTQYGDTTKLKGSDLTTRIDLLVGGTPCQGFSVAGKRGGLDDPRSGLARNFLRLAAECNPRWIVWENVPGASSTNEGQDLLAFAQEVGQLGYGFAWRTLDAADYGALAPRPRLFMVAYLGDWRPPAAVLFDRECFARNKAPRKKTSQRGSPALFTAKGQMAYDDRTNCILDEHGVRLATPLEIGRVMGFPDDWCRIPWRGKPAEECPDGPQYKAYGNSIAVPVLRHLGQRIQIVEQILTRRQND